MARDWSIGNTISLIMEKLNKVAPDNLAQIPFEMSLDATGVWHVDVMVKRHRCEYDVHSENHDLTIALRGAYMRLANWQILERQSPL